MTMTRTLSSPAASSNTAPSSSSVPALSAFNTFGRLIVMINTPASRSVLRNSYGIASDYTARDSCQARPRLGSPGRWRGLPASPEDREEQPADGESAEHEGAEQPAREPQLIARRVSEERPEDRRDTGREQHHDAKMTRHAAFRPRARSDASRTMRAFSRPATMRNVLPYS